MISKNGMKAICPRVKSDKQWGKIGYVHNVTDAKKRKIPEAKERVYLSSPAVQRYYDALGMPPNQLMVQQCRLLNIKRESLDYIGTRYDAKEATLVFPMYDGSGKMVGCRKRRRDGRKWSLKGGREGLFRGQKLDLRLPLVVTEGATDAAAAAQAGFKNIVGRSNCMCGANHVVQLMRKNPNTPVILITDPDEVGYDYGKTFAKDMKNPTIVLAGPTDVREFVGTLRTDFFKEITDALDGSDNQWRVFYKNMLAVGTPIPKVLAALKHIKESW